MAEKLNHLLTVLKSCIDICRECRSYSLGDDMEHCRQLCEDCEKTCELLSDMARRDSPNMLLMARFCAEICRICSEECMLHSNPSCQECAKITNDCAETCMAFWPGK